MSEPSLAQDQILRLSQDYVGIQALRVPSVPDAEDSQSIDDRRFRFVYDPRNGARNNWKNNGLTTFYGAYKDSGKGETTRIDEGR